VADDIGGKNAPLLSPEVYKIFFVPRLQKITERAHLGGASIFLHTDGDITDMMPSIIDAGFDGIECLEGAAGVDILSLKRKYGQKITFMGNLDVSHTLAFETPEIVAKETQFLLEQLKLQRRYIFAPCADIFGSIPVENLLAIKPVLNDFSNY
jgi:uroporphyrinogen decarboxylase